MTDHHYGCAACFQQLTQCGCATAYVVTAEELLRLMALQPDASEIPTTGTLHALEGGTRALAYYRAHCLHGGVTLCALDHDDTWYYAISPRAAFQVCEKYGDECVAVLIPDAHVSGGTVPCAQCADTDTCEECKGSGRLPVVPWVIGSEVSLIEA